MKYNMNRLRWLNKRMKGLQTAEDVAHLLQIPPYKLQLITQFPQYRVFEVKKKNGGKRLIEDPDDTLQALQSRLNAHFQAMYYLHKSESAYGFIIAVKNDVAPRNIETNARRHIGKKWLLKVDMKDFFHYVSAERLTGLFTQAPFYFGAEAAEAICLLCTRLNRLPMGAPTSPVLSNFAAIGLDHSLQAEARTNGWTYTRYADDMCFSADTALNTTHLATIDSIVQSHGYILNEQKTTIYAPTDIKEVTGVVVGETDVFLPEAFISELVQDIAQYKSVMEVKYRTAGFYGESDDWANKFEQYLRGKLAFAEQILGTDDAHYRMLHQAMEEADTPPDDFEPISWNEFSYR